MYKYNPGFTLKPGFTMWLEVLENPGCSNGSYPRYAIRDSAGRVVQAGITCRCGRGCSGTDCIRDDWGDRDTDVEQFRLNPA